MSQAQIKASSDDLQQTQVVLFWLDVLTKLPDWHKERFTLCLFLCSVLSLFNHFQTVLIFVTVTILWAIKWCKFLACNSIYAEHTTLCYYNFVCPSVCHMDGFVKFVEVRIMQFLPHSCPIPLVFAGYVSSRNSNGFTLSRVIK